MAGEKSSTRIVRPLRSGQITIPAEFRERLGIRPDSLLQVTLLEGELRIKPIRTAQTAAGSPWLRELYDLFAPVRQEAEERGYSEKEINAVIDEAIKEVRQSHTIDD